MRFPTRLGLQIGHFDYPNVDPGEQFERVAAAAVTAEQAGFDGLWVMDHFFQIPSIPAGPSMLEGNTLLAALAARTHTAHLGLLVGGVTYRNPAFHAKVTTTLDVISGGRAIFGIGAGWFEQEHRAYGWAFPPLKTRFEQLEDAVVIARKMFTEDSPSYSGRHFAIEEARNEPRPLRGDVPILIGGSGERKTLRLVAKYADASNIVGSLERLRHLVGVIERHCEDVGRDVAEIAVTRLAVLCIAETNDKAKAKADAYTSASGYTPERFESVVIWGDPDRVAEQIDDHLALGISGLIVNLPDVHDGESVQLAGRVLAPALGS